MYGISSLIHELCKRICQTLFLQVRLAKRKEYFDSIDVNGDGVISFHEWLDYAFDHIVGKVNSLK